MLINEMAAEAVRRGIGLGEAAGRLLVSGRVRVRHAAESLLIAAYRERVPVTVHLAIGVDTPDTHRMTDGASLGAASHHDFRLLCALVKQMHTGGVYLNWSSTVVVPETFLKAASVVRNLGVPLEADHHGEFRSNPARSAPRQWKAARQLAAVLWVSGPATMPLPGIMRSCCHWWPLR